MAEGGVTVTAKVAEAHRRLVEEGDVQLGLPVYKPPEVPGWLRRLGEFLIEAWPVIQILFWVLVGAAVLAVAWVLFRRISGAGRVGRASDTEAGPAWRPAPAAARALLAEADRLADEGRYDEAAHLLLFRSIEEIDRHRPHLVRPALTARDIAGAPQIPEAPRGALASIVAAVERSLFARRRLDADDWRQCRSAYEEFALAGAWR